MYDNYTEWASMKNKKNTTLTNSLFAFDFQNLATILLFTSLTLHTDLDGPKVSKKSLLHQNGL